jgi:ABC-type lipoprotein release transport system permease subunit
MDGSAVWLTMQDAESLLFLEGKRTHIAILSRNPEGLKQDLEPYLKGWVATTVREECAELLEINEFRRRALLFMVFIIMAIAATGILNSVLMAAFERIREIGALRALGMTQGGVATMFLLEGTFLGTLAGVVGAILGILLVIHWENNGFTISDAQMQTAGELSIGSMIFTKFSWSGPIRSVIFALIISLLAVIYPIWFATRLNPADAVRSE